MSKEMNHPFTRLLVVLASVTIIVAGLWALSPIVTPVLLALFLAILFSPLYGWLIKRGLPSGLALLVLLLGVTVLGIVLIIFVAAAFNQLASSLSDYGGQLSNRLSELSAWLAERGIDLANLQVVSSEEMTSLLGDFVQFLGRIGSLAASGLLVLLMMIFALLEATGFRSKLVDALGTENPAVARVTEFGRQTIHYFGLRTLVNLCTGTLVAVLLLIMGVDFAVLWGVLTFFLSYIPYLGIFLATVPSVLLAFAEYGAGAALLVIVGVTVINFTAENVIAPALMGKGLSLSPLIVFVSFFFWSWLLGPLGMLLSMPLTLLVMSILESFDETRWLAVMAGASSNASDEGETELSGKP